MGVFCFYAITVSTLGFSDSAYGAHREPHDCNVRIVAYELQHLKPRRAANLVNRWIQHQRCSNLGKEPNNAGRRVEQALVAADNSIVVVAPGWMQVRAQLMLASIDVREGGASTSPSPGAKWCHPLPDRTRPHVDLTRVVHGAFSTLALREVSSPEQDIIAALIAPAELTLHNVSLRELAQHVAASADINVYIDADGLSGRSQAKPRRISVKSEGRPLHQVLVGCLSPMGFRYDIRNEVLVIESVDNTDSSQVTVVYVVDDLVASVEEGKAVVDFSKLARQIKAKCAPESWEREWTEASIRKMESEMALVIRQTHAAHRQIRRVLLRMRAEREQRRQLLGRPESAE